MRLIKINTDHYIICDDSEIKDGDWYWNDLDKAIRVNNTINHSYHKKITHSTRPFGGSATAISLQDVKELIGEVDVEKKAELLYPKTINPDSILQLGGSREAYIKGYNQSIEDNKEKKYTEEDMRKAYMVGKHGGVTQTYYEFNEYIQQLQPKTEWEVEIVDGKLKLK